MGRLLIVLGIIFIATGLSWRFIKKLGLGHLPGDIVIKNEHSSFYFPIASCLLISLIFSLILWIYNYFNH